MAWHDATFFIAGALAAKKRCMCCQKTGIYPTWYEALESFFDQGLSFTRAFSSVELNLAAQQVPAPC